MKTIASPITAKLTATVQRKGVREYLLYGGLLILLFSGLALLDNRLARREVALHLALFVSLLLLLGSLHGWLLERKWFFPHLTTRRKALLTLGAALLGALFFALFSRQVQIGEPNPLYAQIFLPAVLLFVLPWTMYRSILAIAAVPPLRYAPVYFDSLKDVLAEVRWTEDDSRGVKWVFLDDFQEADASGTYVFRTHTPHDVRKQELQFLFKSMLSLHNHNVHPRRPLHFMEHGGAYGWRFHHLPFGWRLGRQRALDPGRTLQQNGVRFRRLSRTERERAGTKLHPKFKVATIYITRTKPIEP